MVWWVKDSGVEVNIMSFIANVIWYWWVIGLGCRGEYHVNHHQCYLVWWVDYHLATSKSLWMLSNIWNGQTSFVHSNSSWEELSNITYWLAGPHKAKSGLIKPEYHIVIHQLLATAQKTMPPIWRCSIWVATISWSDLFRIGTGACVNCFT